MTSSTLERERDKTAGSATISGPLGAHPVETGLGAAGGGVAADALFGTVGREDAVAGVADGGLAGTTIAESIDPKAVITITLSSGCEARTARSRS